MPNPNDDKNLVRILFCALGFSCLVALVFWMLDFRLVNDDVVTSSRVYSSSYYGENGPAPKEPVEWTDVHKRNQLLWQLLLVGSFFPAKILILRRVQNTIWQVLLLLGLFFLATIWILFRLVIWHDWPGVTLEHQTIGTPVLYLFVPFVFTVFDLKSNCKSTLELVRRIPLELLLIVPWSIVWGAIQLFLLHWTWL